MKQKKNLGLDLTEGSVTRQMFLFALPIMLATALQQVYAMVDMIIVGQFLGSTGLSAVSVSSQVVALMTCICVGFSHGAQIVISQYVGARQHDRLGHIIGNTFFVNLVLALIFAAAGLVLHRPVLRLLNAPEAAYEDAAQYLIVCSIGMVFVYGYNMISAVLRGMGDSTRPLLFIAIASIVNTVLDLLFVGPLHLGVFGAALATILSQAVSFLVALVYLYRRRGSFHFDFTPRLLAPRAAILKVLFRQGIPLALQSSAINLSFLFITANVNQFGVAASAAFGVGSKIEHFPAIATQGLSAAVAAMVGQNFAAGKLERIRKTTRIALCSAGTVYLLFAALYLLLPRQLFRLFTSDAEVLDLARLVLGIIVVSYPASTLMNAYRGVIDGVGNANLSLVIGLFDAVVLRIGLSYLFGTVLGWGLPGFVLGYALAQYGTAIPAIVYYLSGAWTRRATLVDSREA